MKSSTPAPSKPTAARPDADAPATPARKPFAAPRLDRHAPLPAVTAGSVMI